jgi:hypothetical protein
MKPIDRAELADIWGVEEGDLPVLESRQPASCEIVKLPVKKSSVNFYNGEHQVSSLQDYYRGLSRGAF